MALMVWNDHFTTGIPIVDEQHRWLIDLVNNAAPVLALDYQRNCLEAEALLDQLIDYAAFHFETEDQLMHEYGIDARHYQHHLQSHDEFASRVTALRKDYANGVTHSGGELLSFLANWLVYHILGEDQALGRQVRAIDAGLSPAEAFESAEGDRRDPAHEALTRTLIDLYAQMTEQNSRLIESNHELERHRHRLEELVSERTQELARALDAAEAANRARSTFIANMSHEIRTPMNAIVGITWALRQHAQDPAQQARLQQVGEATQQLLAIINDLLDLARIESDRMTLEPLDFDLMAVLRETLAGIADKAAAKRLALRLEAEGMPLLVRGDPVRLGQILGNFASNALKFTERGHIVLRAMRQAVVGDRWHLRFELEDTGSGVAPELLPRLFAPFEQGDSSSTRRHGGTGLGLAISRRLAEMMEGSVGASSEPGHGSLFWLELPLHLIAAGNAQPAVPVQASTEGAVSPLAAISPQLLARHRQTLLRLIELLAEDDVRALALWHESAPGLRASLDGRLAPLDTALAGYDFAGAHRLLLEVLETLTEPPSLT